MAERLHASRWPPIRPPVPPRSLAPQECAQLGIDSTNIRAGLLGLTAELPALAGAAVEALQAEPVTAALRHYAAVVGEEAAAAGSGLVPVLAEVREGRTAPPAAPAAAPGASSSEAAASGGGLEVDWDLGAALEAVGGEGEGTEAPSGGGEISWELDASELAAGGGGEGGDAAAPAGISWEVEVEAPAGGDDAAAAGGADASTPAEISWDIDISGVGEAKAAAAEAAAPATPTRAGAGSGAAAAAAAAAADEPATVRRLVEDAAYRARLLDDLFELRAFLTQVCVAWGGVK